MTGANEVCCKDCVPDLLVKSRWLKSQQYDISALSVIRVSITDSLPHGIHILCGGLYLTLRHWDINQHTGMFLLCWSMRHIIYMRCMVLCLLKTSYRCCPHNTECLKNMLCWQRIQMLLIKFICMLWHGNIWLSVHTQWENDQNPSEKIPNVLNIPKKIQHSMDRGNI